MAGDDPSKLLFTKLLASGLSLLMYSGACIRTSVSIFPYKLATKCQHVPSLVECSHYLATLTRRTHVIGPIICCLAQLLQRWLAQLVASSKSFMPPAWIVPARPSSSAATPASHTKLLTCSSGGQREDFCYSFPNAQCDRWAVLGNSGGLEHAISQPLTTLRLVFSLLQCNDYCC